MAVDHLKVAISFIYPKTERKRPEYHGKDGSSDDSLGPSKLVRHALPFLTDASCVDDNRNAWSSYASKFGLAFTHVEDGPF
jgi:hypothetical protein